MALGSPTTRARWSLRIDLRPTSTAPTWGGTATSAGYATWRSRASQRRQGRHSPTGSRSMSNRGR
eukprot:8790129-Pyramimonas_sp.AAC.1